MSTQLISAQHRAKQLNLIQFLQIDLDLAVLLLKVEKIEVEHASDCCLSVIANIRRALETVRHFEGRIEDPTASQQIHTRASELKLDLERLSSLRWVIV